MKRGAEMEAMIGKYRARMKKTGLALIHPVGFCFDLTLDEAVELMEFIDDCRDTIAAAQRDTEPSIVSVVVDEESRVGYLSLRVQLFVVQN